MDHITVCSILTSALNGKSIIDNSTMDELTEAEAKVSKTWTWRLTCIYRLGVFPRLYIFELIYLYSVHNKFNGCHLHTGKWFLFHPLDVWCKRLCNNWVLGYNFLIDQQQQAQKGNSRVRLEMTNKRAKTCWNDRNVNKC